MKIGIVTSGNENLYLFRTLQKLDAAFFVYYDSEQWPYGDKTWGSSLNSVRQGCEWLIKQGCDYVIVSPIYELSLRGDVDFSDKLVPLFELYLTYAFEKSLVGKLALFGDHASLETAQQLVTEFSKNYELTEAQTNTKKFAFPFSFWTKEVPLWDYLLRRLSPREYMVNKIVKNDLKYMKDANADTLIPLQYSYFAYTKTIQSALNQRTYKFHGRDVLELLLKNRIVLKNDNKDEYLVTVKVTGSTHMLDQKKELKRLMSRGDEKLLKVI